MKRIHTTLLLLALLGTALFAQQKGTVEGIWLGTLKLQGAELRLGFTFTKDAEGGLAAVMNSLDQGRAEVNMDQVTLEGGMLTVKSVPLVMEIKGRVDLEKLTWEAEFKQGPATAPLSFVKVDQLPD